MRGKKWLNSYGEKARRMDKLYIAFELSEPAKEKIRTCSTTIACLYDLYDFSAATERPGEKACCSIWLFLTLEVLSLARTVRGMVTCGKVATEAPAVEQTYPPGSAEDEVHNP